MKRETTMTEHERTIRILIALLAQGVREENPNTCTVSGKLFETITVDPVTNIAGMLLQRKIPAMGLKIMPSDWLVLSIEVCAGGKPGFIQMIYKELLDFINSVNFDNNGIPDGYKITTHDFSNCFAVDFPICDKLEIEHRYTKMWDKQKRETKSFLESDNMCDTPEYWLEVSQEYLLKSKENNNG